MNVEGWMNGWSGGWVGEWLGGRNEGKGEEGERREERIPIRKMPLIQVHLPYCKISVTKHTPPRKYKNSKNINSYSFSWFPYCCWVPLLLS